MTKVYFAYYIGFVFGVILTLIFQRFFVYLFCTSK